MSIPLCRQVIQGWMDIYPFHLAIETSISGRVIAQHWQLRKQASSGTSFSLPSSWLESMTGCSSLSNGLQWIFSDVGGIFLLGACWLKDREPSSRFLLWVPATPPVP